MKAKSTIIKSVSGLAILAAVLVIVNIISSTLFFRVDLTTERRFTIASNSKSFLKGVDNDIYVELYLDGDLNPGFKKLASATRDMLDELAVYAKKDLDYELINPNEGSSDKQKKIFEQLKKLGCEPVPVYEAAEDGRNTRTLVFPYAVIYYKDKSSVVNLLDNITGNSGAENLNKSIEGLEYKLMMAIRKLVNTEKPRIAFLEGHGELDELDVMDATAALSEFYTVERGVIGKDPAILDPFKVLIIAKPSRGFSEHDKFVIDQYLMNGGSIFWLVDAVNVTLDSLMRSSETMGMMCDFNIGDQLFKYGIRINPDLIEDIQAARIQINGAPAGQPPKLVPVPWLFNPLLLTNDKSSISRNVNAVQGEFVSTIDTVGEDLQITRTQLLTTSRFTKVNKVPVFVSLSMVNEKPEKAAFSHSFLPVAFLEEGVFPSVFQNRMVPPGIQMNGRTFKTISQLTKMIVVADGDVIRNKVRYRQSKPQISPLGYDEASGQEFGNKQFVLNAVNYLADDEGWMQLRSRNYILRLLDKDKLTNQSFMWKLINVLSPILLIILIGLFIRLIRYYRFVK